MTEQTMELKTDVRTEMREQYKALSKELKNAKLETKRLSRANEYEGTQMYKVEGLKVRARYLHLARTFLNGTPYKVAEQKVREGEGSWNNNKPSPYDLARAISAYPIGGPLVTLTEVEEWLSRS